MKQVGGIFSIKNPVSCENKIVMERNKKKEHLWEVPTFRRKIIIKY